MRRIDAHTTALLDDAVVIWLTTVRHDGQPQSSPVWFVLDGDEFLIYSLADTARLRNLAVNPRVSLNLDSDEGADVVSIEGEARVEGGPPSTEVPAYQAKYRQHIRQIGYTPETFAEAYPVRIRVRPTKLRVD